ncbi:MAG TPA: hypothetical protein VHG51_02100 [Longimicrobiaceae bacterium]|nr:hypothetical protein [Longimicrobiaceae bacterium]
MDGERMLISAPPRGAAGLVTGARVRRAGVGRLLGGAWTAYLAGWSGLVRSGYAPPGTPQPRSGRGAEVGP